MFGGSVGTLLPRREHFGEGGSTRNASRRRGQAAPRTNGKAERFIQTSLREWAYARPYISSDQRAAAVGPWTDGYNLHRPHTGIGDLSPWQRLNNLLGNDT